MAEAELKEVDNYVSRRQNTVAQFIATMPITDLCLETEQRPGSRVSNQCWDYDVLDLEGMRMAAQEAERTEEEN